VQDSQKQALAVTQENEALDAPMAGTSVTLRPGQRAILAVRWSNYCGPSANQPFNLRLVLPNGSGVTPTGGASIPPCLGEAQPSHLGVQPLRLDDPAANVVRDFYDAINNQDYRAAYNLRGADYQAQQPYDDFAAGYKDTALVMALSTDVSATAADRWDISVRIAAEQSDKSIQHFSGTYTVTRENGALKIVAANIAPQ
jgi:hypothetical protein